MAFKIKAHKLMNDSSAVNFVQSPNVGGKLDPRFLVIHYTASGPGSDIAAYFSKPAAKVSAHLVIRRDGSVSQCVPFDEVAFHAGDSRWTDKTGKKFIGLNKFSIGIEIENWGPLKKTGSGWVSWTGQPVDAGKVIEARHKFGVPNGGWEIYTEAQIESSIDAAAAICKAYGIDEIVGHDDISPGRKSDPGPAWTMSSFKAKVFGRSQSDDNLMIVRSPSGLNIRSGPGMEHAAVRPDPLPDGTKVVVQEANGNWRFVTVLNSSGQMDFSGWVHGGFLFEA
ncbi:N-acetylmuramoyl-L-alanine amidase [Aestuariivirga sp.]|uniref:N-acetylmuramoyl-L-alanine amidase n=1 Tax=Aestuariivirga sp. TaxID=2650926 RepID=UPI003593E1EF